MMAYGLGVLCPEFHTGKGALPRQVSLLSGSYLKGAPNSGLTSKQAIR